MSMKPEFFCCIGAELKDEMAGSLKSSRIFMYRAAENQTITDMLADGFFNEADDLRINDLILLYCPEEEDSNAFARVSSIYGGVVKTTKLKGSSDLDFVKKTGDTMTGALNIADIASSNSALLTLTHSNTATYKWNIAPRYNSTTLSVYPGSTETNGFRFATTGFVPASHNARYLGSASLKWKGVYTGVLNNGADLAVPNKAGTLATMDDVELAAQSGTQLYPTGVWYAKMYRGTVVPSGAEYDGRNYADFSQAGRDDDPIIIIYEGQAGRWAEIRRITPPAEYDGYITVTSKIWDIAEQAGQQGGRVLWSHTSREFTPYPLIVSFEDINVTGNSTVVMPQNPGANQIVNKDYVDEAIASIPTPTVDVTQSIDAEIVGTLTITDNSVVSGFSASNYLTVPGTFDLRLTSNSSFEIGGCFTTSSNFGQYITDGEIVIRLVSGNNPKLRVIVNNQTITGATDLVESTKYYIKFEYDGTDYKLWVSTDGSNYTLDVSATASSALLSNNGIIWLGKGGTPTIQSIDMAGWYIKRDGILVWQGMDAPGLHQRVVKGHEVVEFQAPTAGNNYTWYRKYADGWVEQGGRASVTGYGQTSDSTVNLPVTMSDTNFFAQAIILGVGENIGVGQEVAILSTSQISLRINYNSSITRTMCWEVKGMAQG